MTPEAMIEELDRLEHDLPLLIEALRPQLEALAGDNRVRSAKEILLVGHGDSFIAGVAAEHAFSLAAPVRFRPLHGQYFVGYAGAWRRPLDAALVIAVSASGHTPRTVEAIRAAGAQGATTLAVTGSREGGLAAAADRSLLVELPDKQPSPGIRSYQASLTALLMAASSLGETPQALAELLRLPAMVGATVRAAQDCCNAVADLISHAPHVTLAGTGPGYGCALYGAAKLTEAAGLTASGQDLEEWWHIDRFQRPSGLPLVVVAVPGRSRTRALELARKARALGRRVIVVAAHDDAEAIACADEAIPVCGHPSEQFSPLLYHIFGGTLAAALAAALGRTPFDSGPPLTA